MVEILRFIIPMVVRTIGCMANKQPKVKYWLILLNCGGDGDGFWCPINRIIPIAQENMIQNLLLAAFAGSYANVEDLTPSITNAN